MMITCMGDCIDLYCMNTWLPLLLLIFMKKKKIPSFSPIEVQHAAKNTVRLQNLQRMTNNGKCVQAFVNKE